MTEKRFELPETPFNRVYVELTSRCNFSCEFCPNPIMARAGGHMDFALLERILDEIAAADLARLIVFHQQGEPTLYRRLVDAVRAASARGLSSQVTTNGSTLDDRLVDDLLGAGLSRLAISLQTPDEASFRIRGAKNLGFDAFEERVTRSVRRVLAAREAATEVEVALLTSPLGRVALPTTGRDWALVASDEDLHRVLGAWTARVLDGAGEAPERFEVLRAIAMTRASRPNTIRLGPRLRFATRHVGEWPRPTRARRGEWTEARAGTCHGLADHFAILWDGRYSYCCVDYDGRTSGERFQDSSILDFLASRPVQRAIHGFRRLRPVHPYCRRCLGGSVPVMALAKSLGSVLYFKVYRPYFAREAEVP